MEAQYESAECLRQGIGVPHNAHQATRYYKMAADLDMTEHCLSIVTISALTLHIVGMEGGYPDEDEYEPYEEDEESERKIPCQFAWTLPKPDARILRKGVTEKEFFSRTPNFRSVESESTVTTGRSCNVVGRVTSRVRIYNLYV